LQLRLFQTLSEIASEKNSTIILPVPIDLFEPYLRAHSGNTSSTHSGNGSSKSSRARLGEEEEAERLHEEAVAKLSSEQQTMQGGLDSEASNGGTTSRTEDVTALGEEPPRLGSS